MQMDMTDLKAKEHMVGTSEYLIAKCTTRKERLQMQLPSPSLHLLSGRTVATAKKNGAMQAHGGIDIISSHERPLLAKSLNKYQGSSALPHCRARRNIEPDDSKYWW